MKKKPIKNQIKKWGKMGKNGRNSLQKGKN